jgi:hypothetical protein
MGKTGHPDNQCPDMWSSAVIQNEINVRMYCNQAREYTIKLKN